MQTYIDKKTLTIQHCLFDHPLMIYAKINNTHHIFTSGTYCDQSTWSISSSFSPPEFCSGRLVSTIGNCSNSTHSSWSHALPFSCVFGVSGGGTKYMSILVSAAAGIRNWSLLLTSWSLRATSLPLLYEAKATVASLAIRFLSTSLHSFSKKIWAIKPLSDICLPYTYIYIYVLAVAMNNNLLALLFFKKKYERVNPCHISAYHIHIIFLYMFWPDQWIERYVRRGWVYLDLLVL